MAKGGGTSLKWVGTATDDEVTVTSLAALSRTTYDARGGIDTLDLSALTQGLSLELLFGSRSHSFLYPDSPFFGSWWDYSPSGVKISGTLKNFERLIGTQGNDSLRVSGGTLDRYADGGAGDDSIQVTGSTGLNTAVGGLGSDQLFGSYASDLLIGGTYVNSAATGDGTRDHFTMYSGTILDFEFGIDRLVIDAGASPDAAEAAVWQDVTTSYGSAARLTFTSWQTEQVITLVGVSAEAMNSVPKNLILTAPSGVGDIGSRSGDDFIILFGSGAERVILPSGSGHDEVARFDPLLDQLIFADAPSWSLVDYHGESTLLATYDGGASSLLLLGVSNLSSVSWSVG